MKLYIITKRKLLTFTFCLLAGILSVVIAMQGVSAVVEANSTKKKIPIYCVEKEEKVISISFDAAWGNEQTQELLDILNKYNVKTTFFVVGDWVDKYPESVKAIVDAGHEVCNHSDTHPHMPQLSDDKMISQIRNCNDKIKAITGKDPLLFRPPYGDYNNKLIEITDQLGMYCIQWDVDSLDWKDPTPEEIKNRVKSKIKPGSIVLYHNGAKNTPKALPMSIEAIQADGYNIVPISEMICRDKYKIDHDGKQIKSE